MQIETLDPIVQPCSVVFNDLSNNGDDTAWRIVDVNLLCEQCEAFGAWYLAEIPKLNV